MQFFNAKDGARLAYRDSGAGLHVLALAGLTRDGRDFDYLAPHLPPNIRFIRLDSRGRGASEWTGAATYNVQQEASDVLDLLDHLSVPRVAIIGSSRGGLLALALAFAAKTRLLGICFNDIGPVIDPSGLERISAYLGKRPPFATHKALAAAMPALQPQFSNVPQTRWDDEVRKHFIQGADGLELSYDPALKDAFDLAMRGGLADAWPLFGACSDLPIALVRGAASDILSAQTTQEMRRRRPDMHFAEVPERGHIPFLDEPSALSCINAWLAQICG